MRTVRTAPAIAVVAAMMAAGVGAALLRVRPARAVDQATRRPWVVAVGDSYLSGVSGRWAGNGDAAATDALGPGAYGGPAAADPGVDAHTGAAAPGPAPGDDAGASATPPTVGGASTGCHRSRSAPIHLGPLVGSTNLACSGARRATSADGAGHARPGVDAGTATAPGQTRLLEELARDPGRRITMIVLAVGGDLALDGVRAACAGGFAATVAPELAWLLVPGVTGPCRANPAVTARLDPTALDARTAEVRGAIEGVAAAMGRAGYRADSYTIEVLTYPSTLAPGHRNRYRQDAARLHEGGCGFFDDDATWMATALLAALNRAVRDAVTETARANVQLLDVAHALDGHRLCEAGTARLTNRSPGTPGTGLLPAWQRPGAAATAEWVRDMPLLSPPGRDEALHPNYWGQLALRSCLRLAYHGGARRGGTCTPDRTGVGADGLPAMTLS